MTFIIRIKIITVNDAHGIVHLQSVLKAQAASGVDLQYPVFLHLRPDTGRDLNSLSGCQFKSKRGKEIISGASLRSSLRKLQSLVHFLDLFLRILRIFLLHGSHKLCRTHKMKFSNSMHG